MSQTRLAQWVADSMKEDGITARALAFMSEEDRTNTVLAYVDAVGKKIENMQSQLLTMPDTRPIFAAVIRTQLLNLK